MFQSILRSRAARVCSVLLTAGQVMLSVPVAAQSRRPAPAPVPAQTKAKPLPAPNVRVNKTVPTVTAPPAEPAFSAVPTIEEIFRARVFGEPLVPVGEPTAAENIALGRALLAFHRSGGRNWRPTLAAFVTEHPQSAWRASLMANLGTFHAQRHAYVRALDAFEQAWLLAKDATDVRGRAVADHALGEWAVLAVQAGQVRAVEARFVQIAARPVNGTAGVRLAQARETLALLKRERDHLVPCGVEALAVLLTLRGVTVPPALLAHRGSADGMTLVDVQALGGRQGVSLQVVARTTATEVPVPSLVHWRLGHYAAVVERQGDRYRVVDRPGAEPYWISLDTLLEETSGYFLTAEGAPLDGWRAFGSEEAATVRGSNEACPPGGPPPDPPCTDGDPCCQAGGGPPPGPPPPPGPGPGCCGNCGGSGGMPIYRLQPVTASLLLEDTPAGYTPPRGNNISLTVKYHQRQALQPQTFSTANVGPKWEFDWLRFVQEVPNDALGQTTPHVWVGLQVQKNKY